MDPSIIPPMDFIPPMLPQEIALAIVVVSYIPVLVLVSRVMRRDRSPAAVFLLAGGFLAMICEPFTDVTHHVFHGVENMTLLTLMGRHIPYWAALTWPLFTAGGALFLYERLSSPGGLSMKGYWVIVASVIVTNIIMEIPMLHFDAYRYYGPQALMVAHMPLWWLTVNVTGPILGGLILFRFRQWFVGPKLFLLILLPTMTSLAGIMSVSFPIFIAMNGGTTGLPLQLAGVASAIIGLCTLSIFGLIGSSMSRDLAVR